MHPIQSIGYPVHFQNSLPEIKNFISNGNYSKIFVLADSNTEKHCLPLLQPYLPENYDIIEIDPGEENKNIDFCIGVWKNLLDFNAERNSLLINLGGGVITDMGGFAASTFKRGIDFIQVPTTLLAQVDASVGGKTGIDMDHVKNIIGTFTQPKAVFIDSAFLKTLEDCQLVSGYAEMIKHGLIADKKYFDQLKTADPLNIDPALVYRSVEIKNQVITADPHEKGKRKILNFGHTIGHAVESCSLTDKINPLLHGEAIAIGMICESYLSHKINGLIDVELQEVTNAIIKLFPISPITTNNDDLLAVMKNDKKNDNQRIGFALLTKIGECSYDNFVEEDLIVKSLDFYRNLIK
ncbi:MAG TPA: 3-dehydroquinate synthase [Sphingobacteriaceae bacterium]|nr:3-dehydroquinate synthase [Sphingobacteriaceae bacterium]